MLGLAWLRSFGEDAAATGAILASVLLVARFPPIQRLWKWVTKHVEEDRRASLIGELDAYVGPRLARIEQELRPNGGSSLSDRIEQRFRGIDARLERGEGRFAILEQKIADLLEGSER